MTEPTDRDEADQLVPAREVVTLAVTLWLDPDEGQDGNATDGHGTDRAGG